MIKCHELFNHCVLISIFMPISKTEVMRVFSLRYVSAFYICTLFNAYVCKIHSHTSSDIVSCASINRATEMISMSEPDHEKLDELNLIMFKINTGFEFNDHT
jgi:hypothetical protein